MADALADLEALIRQLGPEDLAELDKILEPELNECWLPTPGPQADAFYSEADLLLFGGSAGGGKTDLLLGLSQGPQKRSVIFRRAYVDLRGIEERLLEIIGGRTGYNGQDMVLKREGRLLEFGALEKPGSELSWMGRPHDFIGFDEGAQLSVAKVAFVLGWLRSTKEGQRCRAVIASNPPIGGEGGWLLSWFAPWLDPLFADRALPGELRWAIVRGEETIWVDGPGAVQIDGEEYTPLSRTFVPSRLEDNPYLRETGYKSNLQNLPEPLRSQLLYGDFMAGREDHEWQVIPTEWIKLAQARWARAPERKRRMLALACDPAIGGPDNVALAALHEDNWFAPLITRRAVEIKESSDIADMMLVRRRDDADLSVDGTGGWGSGVKSHLKSNHSIDCASLVFSAASNGATRDGKLNYANLRAEMYWRFREALDPDEGDEVCLPPDPRLAAQLAAPRYTLRGLKILIEDKDEIKKRVGSSPDEADAVVMAWHRRRAVLRAALRAQPTKRRTVSPGRGAWMGV